MGILKRLFSAKADGEYEKGIAAYNRYRYLDAIEHFEKVISGSTPSSSLNRNLARFYCAQAHRNLGIIRFAAGNYSDSLSEFQNAMELNREHVDLFYFIGICHNNLRNFEEAEAAFNHLLKIDPHHMSTKLKLAITFHNLEMWEKSASIYRSILSQNPDYADVRYHLGLALLGTGQAREALVAFKAALAINPNYLEARIKYCITLTYLGEFDEALADLSSLSKKYPGYPDLFYYISIVYACKNERLQAIDRLKQALNINPKYRNARIKLALLYCQEGEFSFALNELEAIEFQGTLEKDLEAAKGALRAVISGPSKTTEAVLNELVPLVGGDKPLEQIIRDFNKSVDITLNFSEMVSLIEKHGTADVENGVWGMLLPLTLDYIKEHPDYADLYNTLGALYLKLNRNTEAAEAFNRAITINPNYIKARTNLFQTLKNLNNLKEALEHGRYLAEVNKIRYPDVITAIGEIYFDMQRCKMSLEKAQEVLAVKPNFAPALLLMAKSYEKLDRPTEAIAVYRRILEITSNPRFNAQASEAIHRLESR